MVNPSWYVSLFFKLISPFMDPDTKAKIHFATATPNPILTTTTASVKQPVVAAADPTTSNTPAAPAAEMDLVEDNDQPKKLQDGGAGGWGVWTSLYKYIDASQLDAAYGGDWFFKYDADVYWEKVVVGNK